MKHRLVQPSIVVAVAIALVMVSSLGQPKLVRGQEDTGNVWYMAGANPQRTSWVVEEVTGPLRVEWYRPIEAYIDQKTQIIASNNNLYVATSKGLIVLNAASGDIVWRYDTELPLGHSPTVVDSVVYIGGFDRKVHALDAVNGTHLWEYDGARAGYGTSPLVVNDGTGFPVVYLGNRDGAFYAVGGQGHPQQGELVWSYDTDGTIHYSAAYMDGVIYFASNDNFAYALDADNGGLVWKSNGLPSDGYQSWWPVIYKDKVIFTGTNPYREDRNSPNLDDSPHGGNYTEGTWEVTAPWPPEAEGAFLGEVYGPQPWSKGYQTIDASRITELWENDTTPHEFKHKYWARPMVMLNLNDGTEFTFDSDGDGHEEYLPFIWWAKPGANLYPPIVDLSGELLYAGNPFQCCSDAKGKVYGWTDDDPGLLSLTGTAVRDGVPIPRGGWAALAEPQALSGGGNMLYRSLCCDRVGDWFSITAPVESGGLWSYNLGEQIPGYDSMWEIANRSISRHVGWYKGALPSTTNGQYHSHGDNNPIIPYNGRTYTHRSNAIIAYGPGVQLERQGQRRQQNQRSQQVQSREQSQLSLIEINNVSDNVPVSISELTDELETEIGKIIESGLLRPGYTTAYLANYGLYSDYYSNPGDTLYTLSKAYPYVNDVLKLQIADYLKDLIIPEYFDPVMYAQTGWADGAPREAMDLPLDIQDVVSTLTKRTDSGSGWTWFYPPHNFYAMYVYARDVPGVDASKLYDLAKDQVKTPTGIPDETLQFTRDPFQHNAWITGYDGFLNLQELAGMSSADAALRQDVIQERDRLLALRNTLFTKDSPWTAENRNYKKTLDLARNFMFLSPELAEYMRNNLYSKVQEALNEYEYVAPFWFVNRYESNFGEMGSQNLYTAPAMLQAKAMIMQESQAELNKFLDAPIFQRGDLFYIQGIVTVLEAGDTQPPSPTPTPGNPVPTPTPTPVGPTPTPQVGPQPFRSLLPVVTQGVEIQATKRCGGLEGSRETSP